MRKVLGVGLLRTIITTKTIELMSLTMAVIHNEIKYLTCQILTITMASKLVSFHELMVAK